jgi:hypothetical protein
MSIKEFAVLVADTPSLTWDDEQVGGIADRGG